MEPLTGWAAYGPWGLAVLTLILALIAVYTAKERLHTRIEGLLLDQFKTNEAVSRAVDALTDNLKARTDAESARRRS